MLCKYLGWFCAHGPILRDRGAPEIDPISFVAAAVLVVGLLMIVRPR